MISKYLTKDFYISLTSIVLIFLLDRISKLYVIQLDKEIFNGDLFSSKFMNISLIWNEGIAFGLFSFNQSHLYNFLTSIIFVVILVVFIMMIKNNGFKKYALVMIFGGALGNLYDRIVSKAVPDFIDFHIDDFHWFIFNVADIFITIGVICMILIELIGNNEKNHEHI
jgi:signal peptidase II